MYEKHFTLKERPFRNVPDTKMFFEGGGRGDILRGLRYAVETGEGIIKVVGEVGSGKTMLCRKLNESLPENIQIVFLANPSLEPEYILHAVSQELGLGGSLSSNRYSVQQRLQKYLLEQHEKGKRVVVLVEEAQCMPPRTLEELRLMSNLETEKHKLLQLVLFGQPELDELLARDDLRQFNERISHALHLKPFSFSELRDYLNHRLRLAGYEGRELFGTNVVRQIYKFSKGSVRRINLLADKTLLAAYAHNDSNISIGHARSAAEDCQYIERIGTEIPWRMTALIIISIIAFVFWLNPNAYTKIQMMTSIIVHEELASDEPEFNEPEFKAKSDESLVAVGVSSQVLNLAHTDSESIESMVKGDKAKNEIIAVVEQKPLLVEDDLSAGIKTIVNERPLLVSPTLNGDEWVESQVKEELTVAFQKAVTIASLDIDERKVIPEYSSVSERVKETIKLIQEAQGSYFTIQLMTAFVDHPSKLQELEEILDSFDSPEEKNDFLVFRGLVDGQQVFVVCFQLFNNLEPARVALSNLPARLKRYQPFVRNISSILRQIGNANA